MAACWTGSGLVAATSGPTVEVVPRLRAGGVRHRMAPHRPERRTGAAGVRCCHLDGVVPSRALGTSLRYHRLPPYRFTRDALPAMPGCGRKGPDGWARAIPAFRGLLPDRRAGCRRDSGAGVRRGAFCRNGNLHMHRCAVGGGPPRCWGNVGQPTWVRVPSGMHVRWRSGVGRLGSLPVGGGRCPRGSRRLRAVVGASSATDTRFGWGTARAPAGWCGGTEEGPRLGDGGAVAHPRSVVEKQGVCPPVWCDAPRRGRPWPSW